MTVALEHTVTVSLEREAFSRATPARLKGSPSLEREAFSRATAARPKGSPSGGMPGLRS